MSEWVWSLLGCVVFLSLAGFVVYRRRFWGIVREFGY